MRNYTVSINNIISIENGIEILNNSVVCDRANLPLPPEVFSNPEIHIDRKSMKKYFMGFDPSFGSSDFFQTNHKFCTPNHGELRIEEFSNLGYGYEKGQISPDRYFAVKQEAPISCLVNFVCPEDIRINQLREEYVQEEGDYIRDTAVSFRACRPLEYYILKNQIYTDMRDMRNHGEDVDTRSEKSSRLNDLHKLFNNDRKDGSRTTDRFDIENFGAFWLAPDHGVKNSRNCVLALCEGAEIEMIVLRDRRLTRSYTPYIFRIRVMSSELIIEDISQVAKLLAR